VTIIAIAKSKQPPPETPLLDPRLLRKTRAVLADAIKAFPRFLAEADAEVAAAIVADLIKAQMALVAHQPPPDPGGELARVLAEIAGED